MKRIFCLLTAIFIAAITYAQTASLGIGNIVTKNGYYRFNKDTAVDRETKKVIHSGKSEVIYNWWSHDNKLTGQLGEISFDQMLIKKDIVFAGKTYSCRKAIGSNSAKKKFTALFVYHDHDLIVAFFKEGEDKGLEITLPEKN